MGIKLKKLNNEDKVSTGGSLSKFWGTFDHAKNNIIGLILIILVGFAILYTVLVYPYIITNFPEASGLMLPKEIWSLLMPFILTIFGILVGKSIS